MKQGLIVLLLQHLGSDLAAAVLLGGRCCDTVEVHMAGLVGVVDQLFQLAELAGILVQGLLRSRGALAVQELLDMTCGDGSDFSDLWVMLLHMVGEGRGQIHQPASVCVAEDPCAVHVSRPFDGVLVHALLKVLVDCG